MVPEGPLRLRAPGAFPLKAGTQDSTHSLGDKELNDIYTTSYDPTARDICKRMSRSLCGVLWTVPCG
jgi:hypothetical protein